jgi:hypothetical protein
MKVYEAKIYQNALSTEPYRFLAENWKEANIILEKFLTETSPDEAPRTHPLRVVSLEELFALDEMVLA